MKIKQLISLGAAALFSVGANAGIIFQDNFDAVATLQRLYHGPTLVLAAIFLQQQPDVTETATVEFAEAADFFECYGPTSSHLLKLNINV